MKLHPTGNLICIKRVKTGEETTIVTPLNSKSDPNQKIVVVETGPEYEGTLEPGDVIHFDPSLTLFAYKPDDATHGRLIVPPGAIFAVVESEPGDDSIIYETENYSDLHKKEKNRNRKLKLN